MIINGENLILGRLASVAAKQALLGKKVDIINAEKVVIVGDTDVIVDKYLKKRNRTTPKKGPFTPRMPDRFVRRIIRGMLSYNKARGREAFKRIMCYIGKPDNIKNEEIETLDSINVLNTTNINYITIKRLCQLIGKKPYEITQ